MIKAVLFVPWVPEPKNNKEKKIRKERKFLSSFSLFLLPISFYVNFEALVPRVCYSLLVASPDFGETNFSKIC